MILINKKYIILNKLGEGNFGSVFKGQNVRTKEFVAIKVEAVDANIKLLKNEAIIYQYLNNIRVAPIVKWFGKDKINHYLVINLLGDSLQTFKNQVQSFSLPFILKVATQLVSILQFIHSRGLIHRDIKPANFLFKNSNDLNKELCHLYIVDFGFSKPFLVNNCHIPEKSINNLIGSLNYASINSHNFIELSRRDDLESLGYLLIYLYN
jgi:serine/threonine protein kinase